MTFIEFIYIKLKIHIYRDILSIAGVLKEGRVLFYTHNMSNLFETHTEILFYMKLFYCLCY